ncbi:MAG: hypothetical protein AAGA64_02315 [Bacteroidota bacterium]
MNKIPPTTFSFHIASNDFNLLLRSFEYIYDRFKEIGFIDHSRFTLSFEDIERPLTKLKNYKHSSTKELSLSFTYSEWSDFTNALYLVSRSIRNPDEGNQLEDLYSLYCLWEDQGQLPWSKE